MSELSSDELLDLGIRSQAAGDVGRAESLYREILQRDPEDADAMQLLGVILAQSGRGDEGLELGRRAAELNPEGADAHCSLGEIYDSLMRPKEAAEQYEIALKLKPDFAEAACKLGRALYGLGRMEESAAALRRALEIQPNYPDALFSLGNTLRAQLKFGEAIDLYRRSIAIAPHNAHVYFNLATALEMDRRPLEALEAYRGAIDAKLEMAHAKYGMLLLALGRWNEGWPELEWLDWYEKQTTGKDRFTQPTWDGAAAHRKTLLLYESWGGMGDVLQFVRFLPRVFDRVGQVILECPGALVDLLSHSLAPARVVEVGGTIGQFDLCLPLESLPHRLGITLENLGASVPYLTVPPDRVAKWMGRIPTDDMLNVGLVWAGSESSRRTNTIEVFAPLSKVGGARFVSLQKGAASGQRPPAGLELIDFTEELLDFADTAAVIEQLDLVIGVDTSTLHLAAALGKPAWVLIPRQSDCRWMLDREDSPWYPTMRLFRQEEFNDWETPARKLASALGDVVKGERVLRT
jgi:tetratricopeptide (TPR) repeat protein